MISVTSIVYKPKSAGSDPEDHYLRIPLDSARLVAGRGIEGDRKGGHPNRNLNIMSFEILEALREEGFSTLPGQMGEQIVIQGIDVGELAEGEQLQKIFEKYEHPLYVRLGELATKMGGHGGMDFIMRYRIIECLRKGLPLDQNVYEGCYWKDL